MHLFIVIFANNRHKDHAFIICIGIQAAPKPLHISLNASQSANFGLQLSKGKGKDDHTFTEVDVGSVAHTAGLRPGHKLIEVNNVNVECESHPQVVARIREMPCRVSLLVATADVDAHYRKLNATILRDPTGIDLY